VPARPGRVDKERCEALHPPEEGHVIHLDAPLSEQLLEIATKEAVAQVAAHREDDDLGREPETLERHIRDCGHRTATARTHLTTLTARA
jgi:hypothetical protein